MNKAKSLLVLIPAFLTLFACGGGGSNAGGGAVPPGNDNGFSSDLLTACASPRSQACTREYAPVCGLGNDGTLDTFDNACTACANEDVDGFFPGECKLPDITACTDPRPQACTLDYRPACGVLDGGELMTYGNACMACGDASVIGFSDGECPIAP